MLAAGALCLLTVPNSTVPAGMVPAVTVPNYTAPAGTVPASTAPAAGFQPALEDLYVCPGFRTQFQVPLSDGEEDCQAGERIPVSSITQLFTGRQGGDLQSNFKKSPNFAI